MTQGIFYSFILKNMLKQVTIFLFYSIFLWKRWLMGKWRCTICGYVYDPEFGDSDGGIAPGTKFEDIPDGWTCPVCGATKDSFEQM